MAALELIVNSGNVSLSAATAKTVLQLCAPSHHRLRLKGYTITVGGTSPVDLTVRLVRQSTAGTGSTRTVYKTEYSAAETIQSTAYYNFTVEPTVTDEIEFKRLQGSYEKIYPMGQEIIIPGTDTNNATRIGLECTATGASTVAAEFRYEE